MAKPLPSPCDRIEEITVTRIFAEAKRLRLNIRTGCGYNDPVREGCDPLGFLAIRAMPGLRTQKFGAERVCEATRLPLPYLRGIAAGFDGRSPEEVATEATDGLYAKGYEIGKDCRVRCVVEEKRTVSSTSRAKADD